MARDTETELETLRIMAGMYCRARHGCDPLCTACRELLAEAARRLARCPRDPRPSCRKCPANCWPPALRARMREIMRYSGPRLPLSHPLLALKHYLKDF